MIGRKPEGYKDLLAYQKAAVVQRMTLELTVSFPKTKTFLSLKDQMDRSARSGTKNIIEGWKRNTTKEYFDFLGFSIGAIEELKDDCADIAKGLYIELMEINPLWRQKGVKGLSESELTSLRFYPLDSSFPPIVQLYLKCKEVLMLLNKLQKSLDVKLDEDRTRPVNEMIRRRMLSDKRSDRQQEKFIESIGLIRLIDGRFIENEEYERRKAGGESVPLFGE